MNLYQKYLNGESQMVFLKLQEKAFRKNNFEEIDKILVEVFQRVKYNLNVIFEELIRMDYLFKKNPIINSDKPLCQPLPNTEELLKKLDKIVEPFGYVPLSLKYFYRIVGSVNFAWDYKSNNNLMWNQADPIQILSLDDLISYISGEYWLEDMQQYFEDKEIGKAFLEVSSDYLHKDNISGGMPYSIQITKKKSVDSKFLFEPNETTFINYLRICFENCGFSRITLAENENDFQEFFEKIKPKLKKI